MMISINPFREQAHHGGSRWFSIQKFLLLLVTKYFLSPREIDILKRNTTQHQPLGKTNPCFINFCLFIKNKSLYTHTHRVFDEIYIHTFNLLFIILHLFYLIDELTSTIIGYLILKIKNYNLIDANSSIGQNK